MGGRVRVARAPSVRPRVLRARAFPLLSPVCSRQRPHAAHGAAAVHRREKKTVRRKASISIQAHSGAALVLLAKPVLEPAGVQQQVGVAQRQQLLHEGVARIALGVRAIQQQRGMAWKDAKIAIKMR